METVSNTAILLQLISFVALCVLVISILEFLYQKDKETHKKIIQEKGRQILSKIGNPSSVSNLWQNLIITMNTMGLEPKTLFIDEDFHLTRTWDGIFLGGSIPRLLAYWSLPTQPLVRCDGASKNESEEIVGEMFDYTNTSVYIPFVTPFTKRGSAIDCREISGFILARRINQNKEQDQDELVIFSAIAYAMEKSLDAISSLNSIEDHKEGQIRAELL